MKTNLPTAWAICDCCEGNGKVDHPAFSNGFTSSEWADMDYDDRERYLGGAYDVPCRECKGSGKVRVRTTPLTFGEKRVLVRQRREAEWRAESAAEYAAERRMGA